MTARLRGQDKKECLHSSAIALPAHRKSWRHRLRDGGMRSLGAQKSAVRMEAWRVARMKLLLWKSHRIGEKLSSQASLIFRCVRPRREDHQIRCESLRLLSNRFGGAVWTSWNPRRIRKLVGAGPGVGAPLVLAGQRAGPRRAVKAGATRHRAARAAAALTARLVRPGKCLASTNGEI